MKISSLDALDRKKKKNDISPLTIFHCTAVKYLISLSTVKINLSFSQKISRAELRHFIMLRPWNTVPWIDHLISLKLFYFTPHHSSHSVHTNANNDALLQYKCFELVDISQRGWREIRQ
jgi:hypothetical protein